MTTRVARAVLRLIARAGSPKDQAHHVSFLDDIYEHQPPAPWRHEARASVQHVVGAVSSHERTSMQIVCGAALMWLALAGVALAPRTSIVMDEPMRSVFAQGAHLVGAAGIAASFVSSSARARGVFVWGGIVPTLVGQLCELTITYPDVDHIVTAGDRVLWVGEAIGAIASIALLVALSRRNQSAVQASWHALCVSFVIALGAYCAYGLAFARVGDALWAALICALIWGNGSFIAGVARHRPVWWSSVS